jgi:MFS transporter, AAHS family, 3-hydroxyphenylpropionic acid transporter
MVAHQAVPFRPAGRPAWIFVWLMLGEVVIGFVMFLLTILSLLVTQGLGIDEATLGLAFASISAGGFTCAFLGGVVADRLGPRFVALTALAFTFVGGVAVAFAPEPLVLAAGEFLIGAAIAIYGVTAYAWINENLPARRGLFLGVYVTSLVIGLAAAGLAVAFLLPLVPSWRTYYLIGAFLALVPAVPLWFLLPPHLFAKEPRRAVRKALANRHVRWISGQQFLTGIFAASYSWAPLYLIQYRGFDVRAAATVLVGSGLLWAFGNLTFGRLADRGWALPAVAVGCFGSGVGYAIFLLYPGSLESIAAFLAISFLWPAAANVPLTLLGQFLGATAQRTEVGILENLFLVGDGIGAASIGILATAWTLEAGMLVVSGSAIVVAGLTFAVMYGVRRSVSVRAQPHESP